jgi:hypothetical protein
MITGFSGFEARLFEYDSWVVSVWPRLSLTIRTIHGLFWRTVPHPHFFTHVRLSRDLQHHHLADYSPTPTLVSSSPQNRQPFCFRSMQIYSLARCGDIIDETWKTFLVLLQQWWVCALCDGFTDWLKKSHIALKKTVSHNSGPTELYTQLY